MARIVLTDASPLIGLALVDGLAWLPALFGTVWVPPTVQQEVLPGLGAPGEAEIAAALRRKQVRPWRKAIPAAEPALPDLDAGETECLHIAMAAGPGQARCSWTNVPAVPWRPSVACTSPARLR